MATVEKDISPARAFNGIIIPKLSLYAAEKLSTSTDDSDDVEYSSLSDEIRNLQSVISVTKDNIDALNERFGGFLDPPALYLNEYQELNDKLQSLEIREKELKERLLLNERLESPMHMSTVEVKFLFYFLCIIPRTIRIYFN